MTILKRALGWIVFALVSVAILVGPWFFGGWEMWWRWGFTSVIALATLVSGVRLVLAGGMALGQDGHAGERFKGRTRLFLCPLAFAPFLVYAAVRCLQAGVPVDAEKSFLLFLLPVVIGLHVVFGFSRRQVRLLFLLLAVDLFLLGAYGLVNHAWTGSRLVLWVPGYAQYTAEQRATGTYFCPDHFAGIMELAFCLGISALLVREKTRPWRLGGLALCAVALAGVVLSKSRGGGMAMLVIGAAGLIWGFHQWSRSVRWFARAGLTAFAAVLLVLFMQFGGEYLRRFGSYFVAGDRPGSETPRLRVLADKLSQTPRGRMYGAAVRAWRTSPVWGIGPGMHQNLWPHFAATDDGDREAGKWPAQRNNTFHSYAVHSDWLQLCEEYGIVGLLLLLVPLGTLGTLLLVDIRREERARRQHDWQDLGPGDHDLTLSGTLALACMTFHSLGDFNLQMPGTTWLLAAFLALPLATILRRETRNG